MKTLRICVTLIFCLCSFTARSYVLMGLDVTFWNTLAGENVKGKNSSSNDPGIFLGYGQNAYYAALRVNNAKTTYQDTATGKENRHDIELIAGRRVSNRLSLFLGYRYSNSIFEKNRTNLKNRETASQFGMGLAWTHAIRSKTRLKTDTSLSYLHSTSQSDSLANGARGMRFSASTGLVHTWSRNYHPNITGHLRYSSVRYATGSSYQETLLGISIGILKLF